jgi:hypothetical protein
MLCFCVCAKSNLRPFTPSLGGFTLPAPRNEGCLQGLASRHSPLRPALFPLSTPSALSPDRHIPRTNTSLAHPVLQQRTPLESALPRNRRVTALESALPKTLALKSFRIRSPKIGGGEGQIVNHKSARQQAPEIPRASLPFSERRAASIGVSTRHGGRPSEGMSAAVLFSRPTSNTKAIPAGPERKHANLTEVKNDET